MTQRGGDGCPIMGIHLVPWSVLRTASLPEVLFTMVSVAINHVGQASGGK